MPFCSLQAISFSWAFLATLQFYSWFLFKFGQGTRDSSYKVPLLCRPRQRYRQVSYRTLSARVQGLYTIVSIRSQCMVVLIWSNEQDQNRIAWHRCCDIECFRVLDRDEKSRFCEGKLVLLLFWRKLSGFHFRSESGYFLWRAYRLDKGCIPDSRTLNTVQNWLKWLLWV